MDRLSDRVVTLVTFGLIAVYLVGMASLAITFDRRFFFNDVVSIVIWLTLGLTLGFAGLGVSRRG